MDVGDFVNFTWVLEFLFLMRRFSDFFDCCIFWFQEVHFQVAHCFAQESVLEFQILCKQGQCAKLSFLVVFIVLLCI